MSYSLDPSLSLPLEIDSVKGFLDPAEGAELYRRAVDACALGPCLEIGSYCGKSTVYRVRLANLKIELCLRSIIIEAVKSTNWVRSTMIPRYLMTGFRL